MGSKSKSILKYDIKNTNFATNIKNELIRKQTFRNRIKYESIHIQNKKNKITNKNMASKHM